MLIEKIESNLNKIVANLNKDTFIYDLLIAYQQPKATISRLKKGDYNLSNINNEVIWKKKLLFHRVTDQDPHIKIDELAKDEKVIKHEPRFLVVTDFKIFLAIDTKTKQTLDIEISEISKHADFFLPWAGLEKAEKDIENPADLKAATKMGKLYDLIIENNQKMNQSKEGKHSLNVFFSRLLFCFFAEDAEIFSKGQFTKAIISHTADDGSDLKPYLEKLFNVLNISERKDYPKYLSDFPYVNGGLFNKTYKIPDLSKQARKIIIECGELDWTNINPDILGSMMQAVVSWSERENLGIHYTSVINIKKIINPLFINSFYDDLQKAENDEKKLKKILRRIYNINIFDPACGSGNFLVISYKELCKIEIEIYKKLQEIDKVSWSIATSGIRLSQFYGIEIDDYAHEVTKLSLWLAEHQMNLFFKEVFGQTRPTLPLSSSGNIICANATLLNWENVCPKNKDKEYYILGNPPYLGSSLQTNEQKSNMTTVFKGISGYKNLDYISCWFLIGAKYILNIDAKLSFVSTNSITQGEQVGLLWPHIFKLGLEIDFAYKSFKWTNYAKGKAGVTCVIIGLRKLSNNPKSLFQDGIRQTVNNINPYLISTKSNIMVSRIPKPLSKLPEMVWGNKPTDNGNFILTQAEKNKLISENYKIKKYIKKYIGSQEFINGTSRWCLWITNETKAEAIKINSIKNKIAKIKEFRLKSDAPSTQMAASMSYKFRQIQHEPDNAIIVPAVSSERRFYIPIGFVNSDFVINNRAYAIYNPPAYVFGAISSRMHMAWVKVVAGRLETRYNYSSSYCYNAFPFPDIDNSQIKFLEEHVFNILDQREKHSEKTIGEMYDPDTMPKSLLKAHQELDLYVDKCYRSNPFNSDNERLEYLFKLYESIINKDNLI